MKAEIVYATLGLMLMLTAFMVAYRIDTLEAELRIDLIESTGYITVTDHIEITVPPDLTEQKARWIARMCDKIGKPVIVRSPYGMHYTDAERRMNAALDQRRE